MSIVSRRAAHRHHRVAFALEASDMLRDDHAATIRAGRSRFVVPDWLRRPSTVTAARASVISACSSVLALIGTAALWDPLFRHVPFALFFAAVAVASWFGGFLHGSVVVLVGMLTCGYMLRAAPSAVVVPSLLVVGGVGCLMSYLSEQLRRSETRTRESESRLRAIVETAVDGIITIDEAGTVTSMNPATTRIFGFAPEEVVGRNVNALMPEPFRSEHDAYLKNYRDTGVKKIIGIGREVVGRRKDGSTFPMELAVSEIPLASGRIFTGIVHDVSERKRAEQDLAHQASELARSNTELEQFAYVASHDLQEPLRAVAGCVQLLKQRYAEKIDAQGDELIRHAVEGASRMQTLLNDLLTFSRVETRGKEPETTDCNVVLQRALANLATAIGESEANVVNEGLPTAAVDATQMTQVFQNLVGNAVKFKGAETPVVHVGAARDDGAWRFHVRDNGIGIEPQYFERIFAVFQRLHTRREYPGTGIGLAICKKTVERHGGRIWVESEPGKGSTFYFTIPDRR
jgi:PAS domain S-box-containing protein